MMDWPLQGGRPWESLGEQLGFGNEAEKGRRRLLSGDGCPKASICVK